MKQILISIAILFVFSSCNDFIEVKTISSFSDDVIFSDPTLAQGAIMGIYNVIGENNSYRNRLWLHMGLNTDTEYRLGTTGSSKADDLIPLYNTNSDLIDGYNNSGADNPWSRIYTALERANLCISGIRKYGNPAQGNDMGHLLGEALALRAFFYYDLIKWWGDVPFRIEPVNPENLYIQKSSRAIIYDQIIADLGEAIPLIYSAGNERTNTVKRLSKDAARGLRARICLSAAGYAMLPDASGNPEIRYVFADESKRRELYTVARNECLDIIKDGIYKLDNSFKDIFYEQCRDNETHGREAIFELPYINGVRGRMVMWFGQKHANDTKYITYSTGGGGSVFVMPSFYYDYNDADTRKNITAQPIEIKYESPVIKQSITNITSIQLTKWRAEWCSKVLSGTDDGVSPIIIRYADILLMYAESDLYLGKTDGEEYFNMVRRRAFGKDINVVSDIDRELTIDNLKQERAFEFCGENIRKYDLIRWGELKAKLDIAKDKMHRLRNLSGEYSDVSARVYWRPSAIDPVYNIHTIEIYGLKRGEMEDKTSTDPSGGWTGVNFPNATSDGISRLDSTWINKIYVGNPDKRQLLPIMSIIISNSNGKLHNDYGYNN